MLKAKFSREEYCKIGRSATIHLPFARDDLVTKIDLAAALGIHKRTLYRWTKKNKLAVATSLPRNPILIEDFLRWVRISDNAERLGRAIKAKAYSKE